jgi:SAM-dependent methyltransferase
MRRIDSSFRDPDGFMFESAGELYRAVNWSYKESYDHLISSGLYNELTQKGLMISFSEVELISPDVKSFYKVIKPERIDFISYPFEWSFNMMKDAAILTLLIQEIAIKYGMSLKDASAYNIQFRNGKPVFIDSLSFEIYPQGRPWIAYRQFCQHFFAPIVLMSKIDASLNRLMIIHLDGIPLDTASKMLPVSTKFNLNVFLHIFLHGKSQKKYEKQKKSFDSQNREFSIGSMKLLIEGLKSAVKVQKWDSRGTEWGAYTNEEVHKREYTIVKKQIIADMLEDVKPGKVLDWGANTGIFSRLAAEKGSFVVSVDADPSCVDQNYLKNGVNEEKNIHPLLLDLMNLSPSIGWGNKERISFNDRFKPDLIMALALIHHIVIKWNVSFEMVASQFAAMAEYLIIEFIPADDDKVQTLLLNRTESFPDYNKVKFEEAFLCFYNIIRQIPCEFNTRIFYLMKRR